MKHTRDQQALVIRMLEEGKPVCIVAKALGIGAQSIRNWRDRYKKGGMEQLLETKKYYTADFKWEAIVYRRQKGLSYAQAAVDLGISNQGTLYAWEKKYREEGLESLLDTRKGRLPKLPGTEKKPKEELTREEQLEAENTNLRMEIAYLKKLKALVEEREKSEKKTK